MRFTRPMRKLVFGLIGAVLLAAVVSGVMGPRSASSSRFLQGGYPVSQQMEVTTYTLGWTNWLIVDEQYDDPPLGVVRGKLLRRRLRIHAPGLMEALLLIAGSTALCIWAWRVLVHRLTLEGYCDYCGYDRRGLESRECPECGHAPPA